MRYIGTLVLVLLAAVATPSAQDSMWVSISDGTKRAALMAVVDQYTTGGPWAAIPARQAADSPLTTDQFRIRAWREGTAARVLVFAVSVNAATKEERETLIATFPIRIGESVELTQTERYGAAHVVITATEQSPLASADPERRYLNVRVSLF
jgi:hypothetical protein